jgi:DNA (cytosine-5)-methyltransferase 1
MVLNFIDLFSGAGGLPEGFIRVGYTPLAHIKMNNYACDMLKTHAAFHCLKSQGKLSVYKKYLCKKQKKEDGHKLWLQVPQDIIDTVTQSEIGKKTINVLSTRTAKNGQPFEDLKRLVDKAGYRLEDYTQIVSQYGVLQNRQRIIIVGWKKERHSVLI